MDNDEWNINYNEYGNILVYLYLFALYTNISYLY